MSPHSIGPCLLCGSETEDRAMAFVEWREPVGNQIWSHIPICRDRAACRSRVETVLEEPWPLRDGTPAPPRPPAVTEPELEPASPWRE